MPIDPRIPLGVNPPQPMQSPLATMGDLLQMQHVKQQMDARQQEQQEAQAIDQALQATNGDDYAAVDWLTQHGHGRAGQFLRKQADDQRKDQLAQIDKSYDTSLKSFDLVDRFVSMADETTWPTVRKMIVSANPQFDPLLPQNYDRQALAKVREAALPAVEKVKNLQVAIGHALNGDYLRGLAGTLSEADNQEQWSRGLTMGQHFLPPEVRDAILSQMPQQFSPEAKARAAQLALTPSERTTQANQAPKVGTFEDYVLRYAQEVKKPPQALSPADIEAARKRYQQADDRQPQITVNTGNASDVSETVAGMMDGSLPPIMPGRATKEYTALMAESHRKGFDLAAAATDWAATQKHVATLNNAQQTRLGQNIDNAAHSLDVIEDLAAQWKGGKFPLLNKARLTLAVGGALGPKAQQIATQLQTQIADVTTELGNVYMGGNSPTDHALGLAAKNLAAEWAEGQLESNVTLARRNLKIRQNSMRNIGVAGASANNPYAAPPASDTAEEWVRDASGKLVKKAK